MKPLQSLNLNIPPVRPAQTGAVPLQTGVVPLDTTTDLGINTLLPTIIQFMLIMMIMKMMMGMMSGLGDASSSGISSKGIKY
jgi:hypothetical protein